MEQQSGSKNTEMVPKTQHMLKRQGHMATSKHAEGLRVPLEPATSSSEHRGVTPLAQVGRRSGMQGSAPFTKPRGDGPD